MKRELLDRLRAARAERRAVVLATWLGSGRHELWDAGAVPAPWTEVAARAVARDQPEQVDGDGGPVFVEPHNPPPRLIVVGAVHIAVPLVAMASLAGFDPVVVDPRGAFATEARFPGVTLVRTWPDQAVRELAPDARTALVTLTHDPKLDDPALEVALGSPAFHIGCLGSRKTHAARRERLAGRGFDDAALDRLRGPAGLAIGARSPAEIAVSILAQIVADLRGAVGAP